MLVSMCGLEWQALHTKHPKLQMLDAYIPRFSKDEFGGMQHNGGYGGSGVDQGERC